MLIVLGYREIIYFKFRVRKLVILYLRKLVILYLNFEGGTN